MEPNPFATLIESLLPKFGNVKQHLAEAIGMTASGFGRGVERNTLSVENLMTLAKVSGTNPSVVLRAAGKQQLADLIEELYGDASKVSGSDRELLSDWNAIDDEELRAHTKQLMKFYAKVGRRVARARQGERRRAASEKPPQRRSA